MLPGLRLDIVDGESDWWLCQWGPLPVANCPVSVLGGFTTSSEQGLGCVCRTPDRNRCVELEQLWDVV